LNVSFGTLIQEEILSGAEVDQLYVYLCYRDTEERVREWCRGGCLRAVKKYDTLPSVELFPEEVVSVIAYIL
jgi:hypothetical protein